ncbi:MAG: MBL fold metallo-hydrolase [Lachnospiraceae bacterium]|nr:MBL fold metallo-hydrolase [Lachnospiraceae bacterium]
MKIEFIHHSSVIVELEKHVLVFDYIKGDNEKFKFEGELPALSNDKDIYFFVSHSHEDHYDSSILDIQKNNPHVYIVADKSVGIGESGFFMKDKVFSKPALKVDFGKKYKYNDIEIKTLKSTESGVAFCVYCEDKKIYFAGDLALWYWEGVGDLINGREMSAYKREINKLTSESWDVAFVPLDPRMKSHAGDGMKYFMENVDCNFIVPIGTWNDFSTIKTFKSMCSNSAFAMRLCDINHINEILKN